MVDIHSHILPAVDDGAKSLETAVRMCQMAASDGVTHIVATPHANYEYQYDRKTCERLVSDVQQSVPEIKILLGCDFHLSSENIHDALTNPRKYAIGDTRYLLVEFSDFGVPQQMENMVFQCQATGLVPIITHPERNAILQRHIELIQQFAEMGCVIQVTANSLTGFWGRQVRKIAETLLENGLVHVLASDAHGTQRRTTVLSEARDHAAKLVGQVAASRLVNETPQRIISNLPLQ